jgi:hypothetical protein
VLDLLTAHHVIENDAKVVSLTSRWTAPFVRPDPDRGERGLERRSTAYGKVETSRFTVVMRRQRMNVLVLACHAEHKPLAPRPDYKRFTVG